MPSYNAVDVIPWQDLAQDLRCIKETDESPLYKDTSVSLMC